MKHSRKNMGEFVSLAFDFVCMKGTVTREERDLMDHIEKWFNHPDALRQALLDWRLRRLEEFIDECRCALDLGPSPEERSRLIRELENYCCWADEVREELGCEE